MLNRYMLMKRSIEGEMWHSITVPRIKDRCPITSPTPSSEASGTSKYTYCFVLTKTAFLTWRLVSGRTLNHNTNFTHRSSDLTLPIFLISIFFWTLSHSLPPSSLTGSIKVASYGVFLPPDWPSPLSHPPDGHQSDSSEISIGLSFPWVSSFKISLALTG